MPIHQHSNRTSVVCIWTLSQLSLMTNDWEFINEICIRFALQSLLFRWRCWQFTILSVRKVRLQPLCPAAEHVTVVCTEPLPCIALKLCAVNQCIHEPEPSKLILARKRWKVWQSLSTFFFDFFYSFLFLSVISVLVTSNLAQCQSVVNHAICAVHLILLLYAYCAAVYINCSLKLWGIFWN